MVVGKNVEQVTVGSYANVAIRPVLVKKRRGKLAAVCTVVYRKM